MAIESGRGAADDEGTAQFVGDDAKEAEPQGQAGRPRPDAEREDKDVAHRGLVPEAEGGRAPVDLALQSRRGFEAHQGALGAELGRPQGLDEELYRVVLPR